MEVRGWPCDCKQLNQADLGSNCPFSWEILPHSQCYFNWKVKCMLAWTSRKMVSLKPKPLKPVEAGLFEFLQKEQDLHVVTTNQMWRGNLQLKEQLPSCPAWQAVKLFQLNRGELPKHFQGEYVMECAQGSAIQSQAKTKVSEVQSQCLKLLVRLKMTKLLVVVLAAYSKPTEASSSTPVRKRTPILLFGDHVLLGCCVGSDLLGPHQTQCFIAIWDNRLWQGYGHYF